MKKILLFSLIIVTAFISLTVSQSYAKLDVLREVDGLVDASKPNVLLMIATGKFMTRPTNESGSANNNEGDKTVVSGGTKPSRFYILKDVLVGIDDSSVSEFGTTDYTTEDGVLDMTKDIINFGLMTYNQRQFASPANKPVVSAYYPYYTTDCFTGSCGKTADSIEATFQGSSFPSGAPTNYYFDFWDASFAQWPIMKDTAGKLWVKIDPDDTLSQAGPTGATFAEETDAIKKFLALQKDGGIAMDDESSGDTRVDDIFKLDDSNDFNDAFEYFRDDIIPNDIHSSTGCFTQNYIIYISDGFGANANTAAAAANATDLYNLTVGGNSTPVKTFVIGVLDLWATATANSSVNSGIGSLRGVLNKIAQAGGTDASEGAAYGLQRTSLPTTASCKNENRDDADCSDYAFFVKDQTELKEALINIASAISAGDFVTGSPSATSSSGSFVLNNVGMLASTEYPEWRGHIRSVDLINDYFHWDAGVTLLIPAADTKLPKAIVNTMAANLDPSWRDTDGDTVVDQPPLMIAVGGKTFRYTDRVLYCKKANNDVDNCISSVLISNEYIGTTADFVSGGVDLNGDGDTLDTVGGIVESTVAANYTYKGVFYLEDYKDRKIYTSNLSGTVLDISDTTNLSAIKTLAGWGALSDNYAKAILYFARGAIDADKSGSVDTGVDLNEDGDTSDTVNSIVESTAEVTREWWLGDVTNVVTVGVGKPINPKDGLSGRDTFRETYTSRSTKLYTGSNDQMLHAYDFDSGEEEFAYIPPDLLSNLKTLYDNAMAESVPEAFMGQPANPTEHVYGIASSPKVNDVQIDDNGDGTYQTNEWHTVLVSGEGPGGNHYFALDVTDPTKAFGTATASGVPGYTLLWHTIMTTPNLAGSYGSTLGETWSVPAFGRIMDGTVNKWVVFAGSGYDDTSYGDGKGEIFHVINVGDGTLLTSSSVTGNFFMAGSSPKIQYGLLADSVTMVQKISSKVHDGYQVDLKGRVYHIDTSNTSTALWDKRELIANGPANNANYVRPTIAKPFHYSPSIWDFDNTSDTSKHLMVLGSGAYDDPEMERQGDDDDGDGTAASDEEGDSFRNTTISADLTSTLYFTIVNPAATPAAMIDAFSVEMSAVSGTEVGVDGNLTGSTVAAGDLTGAVLIASPVLFNNEISAGTFELQALFLVFVPPAAGQLGCSFGNSYLLVFSLGSSDTIVNASETGFAGTTDISNAKSGTAKFVVSMGTGKVSGIGIAGGGSHVVVGQSGYGGGDTSGFNLAGADTWDPIGTTTKLYWKEK